MTNKIQLVNNRAEVAKSYLLSQFKDKPNILALVEVFVEQLQELENTLIELQEVRTLAGAYGWWLDNIGEELDTPRNGYSDSDYKTVLRIEMLKKTASATIADLMRILSLITTDTELSVKTPDKYFIEIVGYLIGIKESMVDEVARLFPINTRKLIVQRDVKPFKFGTVGRGFGSNSTLNNILLYKSGIDEDKRFVPIGTSDYVPPVSNSPSVETLPYIYGTGEAGSTLTYVAGTYTGQLPITQTIQWQINGVDVVGATNSTYTILSADAGKTATVKVVVSNSFGSITVYTNNILISSVVPPSTGLVTGLGLSDRYTTKNVAYDGLFATATHSIQFNVDGSITFTNANGVTSTSAYLTNVGDHHGQDYGLRYSVIYGDILTGLSENTTHPLSSAITLSQSVTSKTTASIEGTYRFTIFKLTDPTATQTVDITMSVTIRRDL